MSLCGAEVIGWKPETVDKAFHEIVAHALNGTDISGWQPNNPPLAGDAFSIIKASEGVGYPNQNWAAQVDWCRSAGALVGHYHFANGLNTATAEANYFWSVVSQKWQPGEPLALDIEGQFFTNAGVDPVGWALAFAMVIYQLSGLKVLIYIDWAHEKAPQYNWQPLVDYNCGLWGAAYNPNGFGDPSPWPFCVIWQYSDTNASGGDSDVLYGDANTFRAYGTPASPVNPTPTTQEDPMFLAKLDGADTVYISNGVWYRWVQDPATLNALVTAGVVTSNIQTVPSLNVLGVPADSLPHDIVNYEFDWYGFDGQVPTSGRTKTSLAIANGWADSIANGINSTTNSARDAVNAHTDSALAALPAPSLNLTDAQVQTAAAAIAADLKANLPAPLLAALGTQLLTANPAK